MENHEDPTGYSPMQTVKRRFFAMRNGVICDVLRKAGSPFRIIFGLNLPQIVEIAAQTGRDAELGRALWANTTTRESMLLAPMLMTPETFSQDEALRWIDSIPCAEVADILCHRLLRHTPYAALLATSLATSLRPMDRYVACRLMFNLLASHTAEAATVAATVGATPHALTDGIAAMLAQEANLMLQ